MSISDNIGYVVFAVDDTSKAVSNASVTVNSFVLATVASNDATLKSVVAVAGAGIVTFYANAAATAETRVNYWILEDPILAQIHRGAGTGSGGSAP
jgi:hypothetical protein